MSYPIIPIQPRMYARRFWVNKGKE